MRAAADQINAIDILKTVVRPQVQHLVEAVREIERRAVVNLVARVPIGRRDHALETDALLDVVNRLSRFGAAVSRGSARVPATNRRSDADA